MTTPSPAERETRAHPGGGGSRALPPPASGGSEFRFRCGGSREGAGSVARVRGRVALPRGGGRIGGGAVTRWAAGRAAVPPTAGTARWVWARARPCAAEARFYRAGVRQGRSRGGEGPRAGACLGRVGAPVTSGGRERPPGAGPTAACGLSPLAWPGAAAGTAPAGGGGEERSPARVAAAAVPRRVCGCHRAAAGLKPPSSTCCGVVESAAVPSARYRTFCVLGVLWLMLLSEA